jgi:hypothetical protein
MDALLAAAYSRSMPVVIAAIAFAAGPSQGRPTFHRDQM